MCFSPSSVSSVGFGLLPYASRFLYVKERICFQIKKSSTKKKNYRLSTTTDEQEVAERALYLPTILVAKNEEILLSIGAERLDSTINLNIPATDILQDLREHDDIVYRWILKQSNLRK